MFTFNFLLTPSHLNTKYLLCRTFWPTGRRSPGPCWSSSTTPRTTGASGWRGWRWRTSGFPSSSREPWLQRLKVKTIFDFSCYWLIQFLASRQARAKVIEAEGEQKGDHIWNETHFVEWKYFSLQGPEGGVRYHQLQLLSAPTEVSQGRLTPYHLHHNPPPRYLQTLSQIAAERNSTIVFPLPIELLGNLMPKDSKPMSSVM